MKPAKATETIGDLISNLAIQVGEINVVVIGDMPMIYNAMSTKTLGALLDPPPSRKSAAGKAAGKKHNPIEEYRNSMYKFRDGDGDKPTRLYFPTGAFKKAIQTAALDLPGVKKAQVGRLCWITEDKVPVYGVPQVLISGVRMADIAHTPDARVRAILSQWCCQFRIRSAHPILKGAEGLKLLMAAGITIGIGDWRQEKGSGSYGQFHVADPKNADFLRIMKSGGRAAQEKAILEPAFYDDQTEELWSDYYTRLAKDQKAASVLVPPAGSNGPEAPLQS